MVILPNTTSCTTYTTASLRCILSHIDTCSEFSLAFEPLPSYLHRHDVDVIWRTNNWGEPNLQVDEYLTRSQLKKILRGLSVISMRLCLLVWKIELEVLKRKKYWLYCISREVMDLVIIPSTPYNMKNLCQFANPLNFTNVQNKN